MKCYNKVHARPLSLWQRSLMIVPNGRFMVHHASWQVELGQAIRYSFHSSSVCNLSNKASEVTSNETMAAMARGPV